jgi:hypothetical protein
MRIIAVSPPFHMRVKLSGKSSAVGLDRVVGGLELGGIGRLGDEGSARDRKAGSPAMPAMMGP